MNFRAGEEMRKRMLDEVLATHDKCKQEKLDPRGTSVWRIIMKNRMTRLAMAAAILIAVLITGYQFGGGIDGANVVWGKVAQRINDVDYLHWYQVTNPIGENTFPSIREGWYANGKMRTVSCGGFSSYGAYQEIDDGEKLLCFDRHNNVTVVANSSLAGYEGFFEALQSEMSLDFSQFGNKTPASVGSDFLIYDFDPPEGADWIGKISITVGRNSLMPIQIKMYYKTEKWYSASDLILFDYEEQAKPPEFFEPPSETKPPHGIGQVVLGGQEVEIELDNARGIEKAIVRLHTRFDGPGEELLLPYRGRYEIVGGPVYFMEITFVIDEGYRSNTAKSCPLWLDQGVKAALGKEDTWPDRRYRNIRYTPVLRATDKENVFMLELSCWLRTREPDL